MHRLIALASVLAAADTAAADCAPTGLTPKVLNGTTAAVADGEGGIVVGAETAPQRDRLEKGDVSVQKGWSFHKVPPKIETLAPGLSVYRTPGPPPSDPAHAGLAEAQREHAEARRTLTEVQSRFAEKHPTVQSAQARFAEAQHRLRQAEAAVPPGVGLLDDRGKPVGWLKQGTKLPRLAAPKVKAITFASSMGRRMTSHVAVTLDGPAPGEAIAMVLADAKGTARSWTSLDPSAPASVVRPFRTHSCMQLPNGTAPSATGDSVVVFWIDATGKKSEATRPMTIVAARP